ncbi:globin domain-containing protein [Streptomyces sp. NPDC052040]|uniref:globin domain-containing protein n=1 Tax=Streptomyces sp. NPDC052040 TaxID=3365682 RepID=UPI0037D89801
MNDDYHALLARREAMRLRDRLLSPAPRGGGPRGSSPAVTGPAGPPEITGPRSRARDGAADQRLITRDLAHVTPFAELIEHLYDAMFERHPYLRQLFPEAMEFQRAHLGRALWFLVQHLDHPEELTAFCVRLGRDHRKLGVLPVHYEVFAEALTEALRRCSRGRLGADAEAAWLRMVRRAAQAMVDGAHAALAEPASWTATVTAHRRHRQDLAVLRVRPAEPFPCRPGQYATLQSPLLPHAWRPYSAVVPPTADGELEFHVRRTGPGGVSDALVARTAVGDTLRLGPAQGTTTLDDPLTRDVLIVAGGTGWATARALLEDLAARRAPGRSAQLFLGARDADDLYDAAVLARWENRCPWLRVVRVIDDGPGAAARAPVVEALTRHGRWGGHDAYLSGPPALVTAAARRLTALGLPPERIHHDPVTETVPVALPPWQAGASA